jgi:hypothetical protein
LRVLKKRELVPSPSFLKVCSKLGVSTD